MAKLVYRLLTMLVSIGGGMLASAIFRKVWKLTPGEGEAPKATDASKSWPEVLTAAALQGAIFAVVTASMERLAAAGTRSLTGTWPGEDSEAQADSGSEGKEKKA
jgi:Protein of unknown function (DUF4235)